MRWLRRAAPVARKSGVTTPCRMTGVTLHSHVRYVRYMPERAADPCSPQHGRRVLAGLDRLLWLNTIRAHQETLRELIS